MRGISTSTSPASASPLPVTAGFSQYDGVLDLKERLAENEAHRRSLEGKHQYVREALDHYRQAIKDQRDHDRRQHEQQLQQLQAELRQAQKTIVVSRRKSH
ncbi:hypothetical protein [Cupriavidus necator]